MPTTVQPTDYKAGYERDGYIVVRGLYEPEQMRPWKQVMVDALAGRMADNPSGVHVWTCDRLPKLLLDAMRMSGSCRFSSRA